MKAAGREPDKSTLGTWEELSGHDADTLRSIFDLVPAKRR